MTDGDCGDDVTPPGEFGIPTCEELKAIRKSLNLPKLEVARRAGLSGNTPIHRLEGGRGDHDGYPPVSVKTLRPVLDVYREEWGDPSDG